MSITSARSPASSTRGWAATPPGPLPSPSACQTSPPTRPCSPSSWPAAGPKPTAPPWPAATSCVPSAEPSPSPLAPNGPGTPLSSDPMTSHTQSQPSARGRVFRYLSYSADPERGTLICRYELDGGEFAERFTLPAGPRWRTDAARAAARLVFLLAGVSYYKTAAPPLIDLGATALRETELVSLREFYLQGGGDCGYRNPLDLTSLRIEARRREPQEAVAAEPAG